MPDENTISPSPSAPVQFIPEDFNRKPQPGTALCLSGGGYRAMLFHLGAFIRLNESGLLSKLKKISSVSGGSISAGVLGLKWKKLNFVNDVAQNLDTEVIALVRQMADKTIDAEAIIGGLFLPGTISSRIEHAYEDVLFGKATLQDLPSDSEGPRFVINATSVQSGALFRFSKPFMADYLVGMIENPDVTLAKAVTASSAFPPVLSPCVLTVDPKQFKTDPSCPLQQKPYTSEIVLADGGVYDNLGLETAWKSYQTILVSDGGGKMQPEPEPKHDWARHAFRINEIIDNQVRSLRKRQIIDSFKDQNDDHDGTYWGLRSHSGDYPVTPQIPTTPARTMELAETPTRLKRLEPEYQERLINWGYAICDTAIRAHIVKGAAMGQLPFPNSPI